MNPTRYVIMANGKGMRWGNFLGIPKHLITIDGKTLLDRLVGQLTRLDPQGEFIVSSANHRMETVGAWRHRPERNELEIDRFVPELITDDVVFLYGDTYYSDEALTQIVEDRRPGIRFFGDTQRIVGVRGTDRKRMVDLLAGLRDRCVEDGFHDCKGWQLFQAASGLEIRPGPVPAEDLPGQPNYTMLEDYVWDFNRPKDFEEFVARRQTQ